MDRGNWGHPMPGWMACMSTDRWAYGYGKGDGLTDRHDLYEVMGRSPSQRQRAYIEYVCSNRDKEEQEVREKMVRGVIGAAGFQEQMDKRVIEIKRLRKRETKKIVCMYLLSKRNMRTVPKLVN